jgi:hypothetical protein
MKEISVGRVDLVSLVVKPILLILSSHGTLQDGPNRRSHVGDVRTVRMVPKKQASNGLQMTIGQEWERSKCGRHKRICDRCCLFLVEPESRLRMRAST